MNGKNNKNGNGNNDDMGTVEPTIVFPDLNSQRIGSDVTQVAGEMGEETFSSVSKEMDLSNGLGKRTVVSGPYYCSCGNAITPQTARRCSHCKRLVCSSCKIEYESGVHCESCFRAFHFNIEKPSFLILLCMEKDITDMRDISELTGIPGDEVKKMVDYMPELITRKKVLFGILKDEIKISNFGRDALYAYEKFYGSDGDVMVVKEAVRKLNYSAENKPAYDEFFRIGKK